ncbi:sensor histidine kinase [Amycolatopsis nigrescens]|uniref:sensor histidine kinase n=1 Tax=Amycolatopsis nigrescens TaxID=381445 RepID=UPI001FE1B01A|nr:sensor histidine kinase [Amycolatopsis nigrescens]
MSAPLPRPRQRQWSPVITVGPYLLLAVLVVVTVLVRRPVDRAVLADLALCALIAACMLWFFTLHPSWWDRPRVMAVFIAVLIVSTLLLVLRNPWFGCFAPALYVYVFRLLPWPWQLAGVAGTAVVAGTAQAYPVDKSTLVGLLGYFAVLAVNVLPMGGFAWFAWRADLRDAQREQALRELSEANRRLEATLAENAGLHEQLLTQAREAGVHDERQRMAREIHDTLAQGLTGIITQLQAAVHLHGDPAGWQRHLDAATGLARESLSEARRSVHALRPEPLRKARLGEALAGVAGRWSALHGVAVQVTTTGSAWPIRPETEFALLRTAQEALANVAKHARATRVGVTLSYMEHEVALDVRDDGTGFDPVRLAGSADGGGFGLVAMRQRIESLSGTLQIESEPGFGTGISACVPAEAGA